MSAVDPTLILVLVKQPDDVALAKALVTALGPEFSCFLLFDKEELCDQFGEITHPHGWDAVTCILNPQHFGLVVSFWGPRDSNLSSNLQLLSFFAEIGVPALEIQRALFQEGVRPAADAAIEPREGYGLPVAYAAPRVLAWDGPDGIGYLSSVLCPREAPFKRPDQLLVTSNLDWHGYSDRHRFQFALTLHRFALDHPELHLLWRPREAELQHFSGKQVLGLLRDQRLENLSIEEVEPVEAIMARCRAGITMVGTSLLDHQVAGKPALVYTCAPTQPFASRLGLRGFCNHRELEALWRELGHAPESFRVDSGVSELDPERLRAEVRSALRRPELGSAWLPIALKYVAYLREGRAARTEIGRLSSGLTNVERQVKAFDKRLGGIEGSLTALGPSVKEFVPKIFDRLGALQRSTIAYKTKKLVARLSG